MPSKQVTFTGTLTWDDPIDPVEPPMETLIQSGDLHYKGCFRLPAYPLRYDWPPKGMCYFNNSLFITGYADNHTVGQVSIPEPKLGVSNLNELNRSVEIQTLQDPTEGTWYTLSAGSGVNLGGVLVHHDRLIVTAYRYYDSDGSQPSSHWARSLDLSQSNGHIGPTQLLVTDKTATPYVHAGNVSGYMALVDSKWIEKFGGPCLTGNCGLPIVTRTSLGPSLFSFNPDDIGKVNPVPTKSLVFYPTTHPTLGPYTPGPDDPNPNNQYNPTMQMGGVVQIGQSVLFFGMIGVGKIGYGEGTSNPELDGQPVPGTNGEVLYCYDPVNPAKGDHAYPYVNYVWAYDADKLAEVASGTREAWDVVPYSTWELNCDFPSWMPRWAGAAYDSVNKKIYLSQTFGDGDSPLIHVYSYGTD